VARDLVKDLKDARFFEDLAPGDSYRSGPVAMREDTILEFAQRYDPQPFHIDPAQAEKTMFGGLISSGWQALSETFAKAVEDGFLRGGAIAWHEFEDLRWLRPVRPDDAISLQFDVLDRAPEQASPDRGRVTFDVTAVNQEKEVVMSYRLSVIVRRRGA
jgi:acyl dehydratase